MSDRIVIAELDAGMIARLVTALDALPVPAGAAGLRPRAAARRTSPLMIAFAAVLLAIAAALAVAPVREAVGEAGKWLQRMLVGPAWVGYYLDLSGSDVAGLPSTRLMFTEGTLPGRPVMPEISGRYADRGPWSLDGERIVVHSGPKVFIGDRQGQVREVVDLGDISLFRSSWIGEREIIGVAEGNNSSMWLVRVDILSGSVDRRALPLQTTFGYYTSIAQFSPDGRHLPVVRASGGCGELSGLYDLRSERMTDLVDGSGRRLTALGWFRDGRLVAALCDPAASRIEYFVSAPNVVPGQPIATLTWSRGAPLPVIDRHRDRLLVLMETGIVQAIGADGRIADLVRLPSRGDEPWAEVALGTPSQDGKQLSFRVRTGPFDRALRTGVVEIATGRVTYACDQGCARLALR